MSKVIHLVPYDGIGGVETAARSMTGHCIEGIDFLVYYIYPPDIDQRGHWEIFNPLSMLQAVRRVLDSKPDLLIVSLWRSCIVGIIAGYFRPRLRVVLFAFAKRCPLDRSLGDSVDGCQSRSCMGGLTGDT